MVRIVAAWSDRCPQTASRILSSLTHPRKIILVVLQIGKIGKANDLSAPLCT
jgi:hypothetical protein